MLVVMGVGDTVNVDIIWQKFLERMKENISPMLFETWFLDTKLVRLENSQATVIVPMHVHKKHLVIDQIGHSQSPLSSVFEFSLIVEYHQVIALYQVEPVEALVR